MVSLHKNKASDNEQQRKKSILFQSPYANMTPMAIKEYLLSGQRLAQPNNCSTELYKHLIDCEFTLEYRNIGNCPL